MTAQEERDLLIERLQLLVEFKDAQPDGLIRLKPSYIAYVAQEAIDVLKKLPVL